MFIITILGVEVFPWVAPQATSMFLYPKEKKKARCPVSYWESYIKKRERLQGGRRTFSGKMRNQF
jgi:hypothetical protein